MPEVRGRRWWPSCVAGRIASGTTSSSPWLCLLAMCSVLLAAMMLLLCRGCVVRLFDVNVGGFHVRQMAIPALDRGVEKKKLKPTTDDRAPDTNRKPTPEHRAPDTNDTLSRYPPLTSPQLYNSSSRRILVYTRQLCCYPKTTPGGSQQSVMLRCCPQQFCFDPSSTPSHTNTRPTQGACIYEWSWYRAPQALQIYYPLNRSNSHRTLLTTRTRILIVISL